MWWHFVAIIQRPFLDRTSRTPNEQMVSIKELSIANTYIRTTHIFYSKAHLTNDFQLSRATSRAASTGRLQTDDKMATPNKVYLTVDETGILKNRPQTAETAAKTSELLQENHDVPPSDIHILLTQLTRDVEASHILQPARLSQSYCSSPT